MTTGVALRRAAKFRPGDLPTVARALGWMLASRVLLLTVRFAGVRRLLGIRPAGEPEREPGPRPALSPAAERALRVTLRVLEPTVLHVTCLPRALVLERMLSAYRIPCELLLGCDTEDGFRAHAWVEIDGRPVGFEEGGAASWRPLARFRSEAARALYAWERS